MGAFNDNQLLALINLGYLIGALPDKWRRWKEDNGLEGTQALNAFYVSAGFRDGYEYWKDLADNGGVPPVLGATEGWTGLENCA